ncbi:MAG: hypothetical protein AB7K52_05205 [Phycisphaerales bacterium]
MNMQLGLAAVALSATSALASVSYTGGTLTENFNSLPSTGVMSGFFTGTGVHAGIPGLTTWVGARLGGTGSAMNFIANAGDSNSGALFSYGDVDATERALGSLASGSNIGAFGVELVNDTSDTLTELVFSFDREQYRSSTSASGTPNTLAFAYGFSGGMITSANFLSDAGMTAHAAGDLVGDAPVASNGIITPPSVLAVGFTITGISWAPGQSLFIRWQDFNDQGNDAGLAVDNLSFTARVPTPGTAALVGLAGLAGLRRRR